MIKQDILWVGIGEAGGRVTKEILDRDSKYVGLFINTSSSDLDKLGDVSNIYHIPGAKGTGRSRSKSKEFAKRHFESMIDNILSFSTQRIINIVFSTSGGSGSGLAPTIAKMLISMKNDREVQLDKIINLVIILPSINESKVALQNCVSCWNEVMSIQKLVDNIMFIDNNCGKHITDINEEFAELYDSMMDVTQEFDEDYVQIDESDLETVMLAKGCTSIFRIDVDHKGNIKENLKSVYEDSIFAKIDNFRSTHLCMSFNNVDYDAIMEEFKPKEEHFKGYNSQDNIMAVSGLKPPKETIELIQTELQHRINEAELEEDNDDEDYIIEDNTVKPKTNSVKSKPREKATKKTTKKKMSKLFDQDFWDNEVF